MLHQNILCHRLVSEKKVNYRSYGYHTSANLLHFAMDQMVLSIKDILFFKDISEKNAKL